MQRYRLFAARDGDVIDQIILAEDTDEARLIAAHRIVETFGLETDSRDLDEIMADTDGAVLDLAFDSEISDVLVDWAYSQLTFLNHLRSRVEPGLRPAIAVCSASMLELVAMIQGIDASLRPKFPLSYI